MQRNAPLSAIVDPPAVDPVNLKETSEIIDQKSGDMQQNTAIPVVVNTPAGDQVAPVVTRKIRKKKTNEIVNKKSKKMQQNTALPVVVNVPADDQVVSSVKRKTRTTSVDVEQNSKKKRKIYNKTAFSEINSSYNGVVSQVHKFLPSDLHERVRTWLNSGIIPKERPAMKLFDSMYTVPRGEAFFVMREPGDVGKLWRPWTAGTKVECTSLDETQDHPLVGLFQFCRASERGSVNFNFAAVTEYRLATDHTPIRSVQDKLTKGVDPVIQINWGGARVMRFKSETHAVVAETVVSDGDLLSIDGPAKKDFKRGLLSIDGPPTTSFVTHFNITLSYCDLSKFSKA